jgi:hypothetical protein
MSVEVIMIDRKLEVQRLGLYGRWARTEKPIYIATIMVILATVGVFLAIDSGNAVAGSVICLIVVFASMPYNARRIEKMRRGKEILDRYSPERNPRPLGL